MRRGSRQTQRPASEPPGPTVAADDAPTSCLGDNGTASLPWALSTATCSAQVRRPASRPSFPTPSQPQRPTPRCRQICAGTTSSCSNFPGGSVHFRPFPLEKISPAPGNRIQTFLQHAWTIATHDLVYKGAERSWGRARIASQVKAMLEQAETAIGAAAVEDVVAMVDRPYRQYREVRKVVVELEERWSNESLPEDRTTLATNVVALMRALKMKSSDFFRLVDDATRSGRGAEMKNLSPFAACVQSVIDGREGELLGYLQGKRRAKDFVVVLPLELELPTGWQGRELPRARRL